MSARVTLHAEAMLGIARAEGCVDEVTDEIFRFSEALAGSDELRVTLNDQYLPTEKRQQIVEDLLGGKAHRTTVGLISMLVGAGRVAELPEIAEKLVELNAAAQGRQVALVRSAVALTDDQQTRLAAALSTSMGSPVEVRHTIDPSVVGGIVAEIGDTVIDGSVRSRLAQLREAF